MMCLTDEVLRAKFDGELGQSEALEVENHLAACAGCRERADIIAAQADKVQRVFSTLAPLPGEAAPDAAFALARFKARRLAVEAPRPALLRRVLAGRMRPAWGALAVASLILLLMSFAPARIWAQKFLAMLRVEKITVVPVDLKALGGQNGDTAAGKMLGEMLSNDVVITIHGELQAVASADEASQRAGYKVRLLSDRADAPQLTVEGEQAFHMTVDRGRAQAIMDEAGRSDLSLPASLDGATIAAHISPAVVARYGHCPSEKHKDSGGPPAADAANDAHSYGDCVTVMQVPSPIVSVPPDLNIAALMEVGLQAAGMNAEQAHTFCQTVDWTSTLVIPLPSFVDSYQKVAVDGVEGTLINVPRRGHRRPAGYTLVWVKNGMISSVSGFGDSSNAVPLAETLN